MHLDHIPIWILFIGTVLLVLLAIEAGYRVGWVMHRRSDSEKESPVAASSGAILGVAAFMLAFTFGIVADRYSAKQELVREDAVAIRTAWQRTDFLPEADRAEARSQLSEYLNLRINFVHTLTIKPEEMKSHIAEAQQLQDKLWSTAVKNARLDMNSDVAALYIESLNEVDGVNAKRLAIGVHARIHSEIWLVLYGITTLGMVSVGYQTGIAGSKRSMVLPVLAVCFSLVFGLIATLDRPETGVRFVTQQPLIDLQNTMNKSSR